MIQCSERAVGLQAAGAVPSVMGSALPCRKAVAKVLRTLGSHVARAFRDDRSTAFHANNLTGTWKADRCRERRECRRSSTQ